ncbi:MAG: L-histidine N(alpha)-methyltransferase [Holophagae bacterium]
MSRIRVDRLRSPEDVGEAEAQTVWDALLAPLPAINPKYFYDDVGSALFEEITELEEYYQMRAELALLETIADDIVVRAQPHEMVELGSGAGRKVHLLLDAIQRRGLLTGCTLFDINGSFLVDSATRLSSDYPEILVEGVLGDFTRDLDSIGVGQRRLFVFFGGTIGNIEPWSMPGFLQMVRRAMAADDRFLVGLDLVKDTDRLEAAYNDSAGVTARFNRNTLSVLNARFGTDFEPESFEHRAFWDAEHEWIEMRLRATRSQSVEMPGDQRILELERGAEIRTEISCKYTLKSFSTILTEPGLELDRWWRDADGDFALALVKPSTDCRVESS